MLVLLRGEGPDGASYRPPVAVALTAGRSSGRPSPLLCRPGLSQEFSGAADERAHGPPSHRCSRTPPPGRARGRPRRPPGPRRPPASPPATGPAPRGCRRGRRGRRHPPPLEARRALLELGLQPGLEPGRLLAAAAVAVDTLQADPREPVLLNYAGVVFYELGALTAAEPLFKAAQRLDPSCPTSAQPRGVRAPQARGRARTWRRPPARCATSSRPSSASPPPPARPRA